MSGIAAGAQAGAAFGPWGAAIGGALGAASDVASAAAGGPFMGGDSHASYGNVNQDGSGWTVNVGGGSASTDNRQTKTDTRADPVADQFANSIGYPGAPAAMQAGVHPVAMLAVAGLLGFALLRKLGKR